MKLFYDGIPSEETHTLSICFGDVWDLLRAWNIPGLGC